MEKKVKEYYQKYEDGELIKKNLSDKIKADMFAHKLMAMHERVGKTSRDVYDVWLFLKNRARAKLRTETVFLLKARMESEK